VLIEDNREVLVALVLGGWMTREFKLGNSRRRQIEQSLGKHLFQPGKGGEVRTYFAEKKWKDSRKKPNLFLREILKLKRKKERKRKVKKSWQAGAKI